MLAAAVRALTIPASVGGEGRVRWPAAVGVDEPIAPASAQQGVFALGLGAEAPYHSRQRHAVFEPDWILLHRWWLARLAARPVCTIQRLETRAPTSLAEVRC